MKRLIILSFFLLTPLWSFSQIGFPKLIQLSEDSGIVFSIKQGKKLLEYKYRLEMLEDISDTLIFRLTQAENLITSQSNTINSLTLELELYEGLETTNRQMKHIFQEEIKTQSQKIETQSKKIQKQKTVKSALWIVSIGLFLGIFI